MVNKKIHHSISDAHGGYHTYQPAPDASLAMYLEEFTTLVDTIEHYSSCIGYNMALINYEPTTTTLDAKRKGAYNKFLVMDFLKKVLHNHFGSLLTNLDNARWALIIYGQDVPTIKGKSIRGNAMPMLMQIPSNVPSPILDDHRDVTLCADFFFVQGLPFFHSISRKMKFCMVLPIKNLKCNTMKSEMNNTLQLDQARGFRVVDIHSKMEFKCIQHNFLPVTFNLIPMMHM